jgi:hypothetical protein
LFNDLLSQQDNQSSWNPLDRQPSQLPHPSEYTFPPANTTQRRNSYHNLFPPQESMLPEVPFYRQQRSMSYSFGQQEEDDDMFYSTNHHHLFLDTIMQEEEEEEEEIHFERTRSKSSSIMMNDIWHPTTVDNNRRSSLIPPPTYNCEINQLRERIRRFSLAPISSSLLERYCISMLQLVLTNSPCSNTSLMNTQQPLPNDSLFFNNNQRRHSLAGPLLAPNQQEMVLSELAVRERLPLSPTPSASKSEIPTHNKMDDMGKGTRLDSDILLEAIFYVVEFKGGRSDVFYSHRQQQVQLNDLVLVEADRGRDLGKVTQVNISRQQLQSYYTQLKQSNTNNMMQEEVSVKKKYLASEMYIKAIFRRARQDEITLLMAKGQDEAKALMVCQSKIKQKKLNMQVVDAEYQWLVLHYVIN